MIGSLGKHFSATSLIIRYAAKYQGISTCRIPTDSAHRSSQGSPLICAPSLSRSRLTSYGEVTSASLGVYCILHPQSLQVSGAPCLLPVADTKTSSQLMQSSEDLLKMDRPS